MDRELSLEFRSARRRRRYLWVAGSLGLLLVLGLGLPDWLRPALARDLVRTGRVDRGAIEGIVEASGLVIPAFESLLSSPIEARVEKILRRPGETVAAGEEILVLDTSPSRVELGRLEDQLRKKINEQAQLRLALEESLGSLDGRIAAQRLDLEALVYRAEQSRTLRAEGLVSEQVLRAAEVDEKKARIELAQLQAQATREERATAARLEGIGLDLAILGRDRDEARRQLGLATRADRSGVLTWVIPQEGATVRKGEVLARIADLHSFRVKAKISDIHASRLNVGAAIRVITGGQPLTGTLTRIDPTIENGALQFEVTLDEARHPALRSNLAVDVLVVTAARQDVLRAPKGPYLVGGSTQPVFVVDPHDPSRALRRSVRFGLAGYENHEVLDGLAENDEIILSDMRDYFHLSRINLR